MTRVCAWCGVRLEANIRDVRNQSPITHGVCPSCAEKVLGFERRRLGEMLETLEAPVIAVDRDGVVFSANGRAQKLLNRNLATMQGKKGGDIIECQYSRSPGGCGSSEHCQTGCVIRRSVTHTFSTGEGVERQPAVQLVFTPSGVEESRFVISTEKLGDLIMLRIDEVDGTDPSS